MRVIITFFILFLCFANLFAQVPSTPVLISPANGQLNVSLVPTISWSGSGESFDIMLSTNSGFGSFSHQFHIVGGNSIVLPAQVLTYSTIYYWKARASNSSGSSPFSTVFSFMTQSITIPSAPVLVIPVNGTLSSSLTPLLRWDSSPGADSHSVSVATDTGFNNIVYSKTLSTNMQQMPSGIIQHDKWYYWKVRASNAAGSSPYSAVWRFMSDFADIKLISSGIPVEFKLYKNYPNPFNPSTKIKFDIPKTSSVSLIVLDINGRIVSQLVNENLEAGAYETDFNAASLPSGIYFYKLVTEKFSETKKMILVK